MSSFDLQVSIHQGSGHVFRKGINGKYAMMLKVRNHFMTPGDDLGRRGTVVNSMGRSERTLDRAKQCVISKKDPQWQVFSHRGAVRRLLTSL